MHSRNQALLATAMLVAISVISGCKHTSPDQTQTGTVLDEITGQPIGGAFVLATYRRCGGVMGGHSSCWCENTKGMFTGPSGKFQFPVVDEAGRPLEFPTAIKADYRYVRAQIVNYDKRSSDSALFWKDQNVILGAQNSEKPELNFQSHEASCYRAATRQDAAAGIQFMRLELAEREEYGKPQSSLDSWWDTIADRNALPNAPGKTLVAESAEVEQAVQKEDAEFVSRRAAARAVLASARRSVELGVSVDPGFHGQTPKSCLSYGRKELIPVLISGLKTAGINLIANEPGRNEPCISPRDADEAKRLAHQVGNEYVASVQTRVKRYPRE